MSRPYLHQIQPSGASDGNIPVWNAATGRWVAAAPVDPTLALYTAKGDILVGTAAGARSALHLGTTAYVLTADPTQATGMKWAPAAGGGGKETALFKVSGTLITGVGATRLYNDTGVTWTISSIRASVETAPSGGSVVIDVNKNGVTLFTTQANRPTITTTNLTSGTVTSMDITTVANGDYITVDLDTVTSPASNLTMGMVFA